MSEAQVMMTFIKGAVSEMSQEAQDLFNKIVETQHKMVANEKDAERRAAKMLALAYVVQLIGEAE